MIRKTAVVAVVAQLSFLVTEVHQCLHKATSHNRTCFVNFVTRAHVDVAIFVRMSIHFPFFCAAEPKP